MSRPACSVFPSVDKFAWGPPVDFQLPPPLSTGLRCTKARLLASMDRGDDNCSFLIADTPSPFPRRQWTKRREISDRDARAQRLADRRREATPSAAATKNNKRRRAMKDLDGFVTASEGDEDDDDEDDDEDEEDEEDDEDDCGTEDETSDEDDDDGSLPPPRKRLIRSCSARNKNLWTGGPSLERIEQDVLTSPVGSSPVGGSDPLTPSASADEGGVSSKALLERLRVLHDVVQRQNTTIQNQQDRLDAFDLLESGSGSKDDDDDGDFRGRAGAGAGDGQKQSQSAVDADLLQKVPAGVLASRFRRQWDRVFSSGAKDIDALVNVGVSPDVAASIQRFARSLALRVRVMTCRTALRALGFSSSAIDAMVSAMATLGARAPDAGCPNTVEGLLLTGPPGTGKTFLMDTISAYVKRDCGLLVPEVLAVDRGMMRAQYSGVAEQDIWAVFEAANATPIPVTWRAVVDFLVHMGMNRGDLEARALRSAKAAAATGQTTGVVGVVDSLDGTVDLAASVGVILMDECQSILSKSSEAHDSGISTTANAAMGRPCRPDTLVVVLAATNDIEQVHPASRSRLKNLFVPRPDADAALVVMNSVLTNAIEGFDGFPSPGAQAAVMAAVAEAENDIRTMRMIAAEVGSCRMATSQGIVAGRSFLEACLSQLQFSESGDVAVPAPVPLPDLKGASISHLPTEADYISVATRVAKEVHGVAEFTLSRLLGPENDDAERRPNAGILIEEDEEE